MNKIEIYKQIAKLECQVFFLAIKISYLEMIVWIEEKHVRLLEAINERRAR